MTDVRVTVRRGAVTEILTSAEVRSEMGRRADAIAEATLAAAGGLTEVRVYAETSPAHRYSAGRVRHAVWVGHPNAAGRKRGREALEASIDAGRT